ncbi:hypothetical protein RDI58_017794 [Solanum bulbocastanum]|uniref:RNA-directed DNA polymerase, eukaryota, reverse transcriptase zinc-binding domain protein n=1 Tax=Solanum bulbocastanum TaxID=147425 RepID=A0AAN8TCZ7_SOLBU
MRASPSIVNIVSFWGIQSFNVEHWRGKKREKPIKKNATVSTDNETKMAKGTNVADINDTLANNIDNTIASTSKVIVPKVDKFFTASTTVEVISLEVNPTNVNVIKVADIPTQANRIKFRDVVKEVWDNEIMGNPMWRLQNKIKNLSKALRKWSKECIGDVFDIVKQKEEHNKLMKEQYEMNNSDHNRILLQKAEADYIKWLKLQDSILRQKARIKWAEKGKTNSKYFYSVIRGRKRHAQILRIKDFTKRWLDNTDQISQTSIDHFNNIFTHSNDIRASSDSFLRYLDTLVTDIDNDSLEAIPTEEEIKADVVSMDPNSCAGLDGYKAIQVDIGNMEEKDHCIWTPTTDGNLSCSSS